MRSLIAGFLLLLLCALLLLGTALTFLGALWRPVARLDASPKRRY